MSFLKSPTIPLFVQLSVKVYIKEKPNIRVTGFLWEESTGDHWIFHTKGQ